HRRTLAEPDRSRITALIAALGDDSYDVREKASAELVTLGPPAAPLLRQATKDADIEIVRRAEKCLRRIDQHTGPAVTAAAAHLLAVRRPAGAVEALLAYVPFADDDTVADALRSALASLAAHHGKADTVLLDAVVDKVPARRAAAAAALIRA